MVPQRGEKRRLIDLANRNAGAWLPEPVQSGDCAQYDALETLQAVLKLPSLPRRIECFDNLDDQGSETGRGRWSSVTMAACEGGVPQISGSEARSVTVAGLTPPRVSPKLEERRRITPPPRMMIRRHARSCAPSIPQAARAGWSVFPTWF